MLKKYQEKRDFKKTKEPSGRKKKADTGSLIFMIHKHHARNLHYDLRLELDGVLKSWAIPKGPSNDPGDRRLAMMVEDHPYDYKDFEWVIPEGQYGAGPTLIWDTGTYTPDPNDKDKKSNEKHIRAGLKKGHLRFILHGKKLHGEYSLVHMPIEKKDNAWLLIKSDDEYAQEEIPDIDLSVVSGKTIEELEWDNVSKDILQKTKKWAMPKDIKPMLAIITDKPFDKKGWIFEIKFDGYRAIAEVEKGQVRLYSRNGLSFNAYFPQIVRELKWYDDVVFDGEIIAFLDPENPHGDFWSLQDYIKTGKWVSVYYIFDILYYDGHVFSDLPLLERKSILQSILKDSPHVWFSSHIEEYGKDFFQIIKEKNMEGIIGKDGNSPYLFGERSAYWVKVKNILTQEAVICGYTEPRGSRKWFWALILGIYKRGTLRYIGHVGGGFDEKSIQEIRKLLDRDRTGDCPFENKPKTNTKPTWVAPKIVCEVKFREWTKDGYMRQPIFLGIREDKNPEEVTFDKSMASLEKRSRGPDTFFIRSGDMWNSHESRELEWDVVKLRRTKQYKDWMRSSRFAEMLSFSNLDKVYFPEDGITKGDLIGYYERIAPFILPYLLDRPESLLRYPDGIHSEGFYQKNMNKEDPPSWFRTESVYSESEDRTINYPMVQNTESLLYLVNLGCIDLHPWSSRVESLEYPDYIIFDFDPEDIGFRQVIKAVQTTHELLDEIGAASFCKTSGATGMHILVPTRARYTYEQAAGFAKLINTVVCSKLPDTTSIERLPKNRQKKVYLDYLQNRKGQTIASVYSVRPRKGVLVSTPIAWSELNSKLDPWKFNMHTIFSRLDKLWDIWGWMLDQGFDMERSIKKLEKILK